MKRGSNIYTNIFLDLLLIIIFTLLPTWIKLLWDGASGNDVELIHFYSRGEFLLYAVAILSSSLMLLEFYNIKRRIWCFIPLFVISIFYVIIFSALNGPSDAEDKSLNTSLLYWVSLVGMIVAIIFFLVGQYLQYSHQNPDVGEVRRNEIGAIENNIRQ